LATSAVLHPSSAATWSWARSNPILASVLAKWPFEGLPKAFSKNARIVAITSRSMGVLALWST